MFGKLRLWPARGAGLLLSTLAACGVDRHGHDHEQELITSVRLELTPPGGSPIGAAFSDPDGDGGMPAKVDPLRLAPATRYALAVRFFDELSEPNVEVTAEIAAEAAEHQLFFLGSALTSTAPIARYGYADRDAQGAPLGLAGTLETLSAGRGELQVVLRHLPPVNGVAAKTAALAEVLARDGLSALPGETDVSVRFELTVR